ncbi:hypothetical protein CLV71_101551 [Actinophytocola oryzae]|uniref:Uncharacterized protein n=1 Tax=Actinophytocola oryzae TaxID=502181 RepID=A0A4R7W699_9PSEU|nr:hypothetical protein CLV71_101551 [Actinophytocola oryzae]
MGLAVLAGVHPRRLLVVGVLIMTFFRLEKVSDQVVGLR